MVKFAGGRKSSVLGDGQADSWPTILSTFFFTFLGMFTFWSSKLWLQEVLVDLRLPLFQVLYVQADSCSATTDNPMTGQTLNQ